MTVIAAGCAPAVARATWWHRRTYEAGEPGGAVFTLAAKLMEIVAQAAFRLLDARTLARDTQVARVLLAIIVALQELCVRGNRLLGLARQLADGGADEATGAAFDRLLNEQVAAIGSLRGTLDAARPLLASVDAQVYPALAPFLDEKSGLLTRWEQQRRTSTFSTTTLFFLDGAAVEHLASAASAQATVDGLVGDRGDFVLTVADTVRQVRATEVRDIRAPGPGGADRLGPEIDRAQAELDRALGICTDLLASIEAAVGEQTMARLRRELLPGKSDVEPGRRAKS